MDISALKYDSRGLIPAIIQDCATNQVLMLAWMNEESLKITIEEGKTCFFSRSRNALWRKGETSGNVQEVRSIRADCDGDTLLISVSSRGPACHTGAKSCFFNPLCGVQGESEPFSLPALEKLLIGRLENPKEGSYTSYLFEKGEDKLLKKIGEETSEVIIASKNADEGELVYELADLMYHSMALLAFKGIPIRAVLDELTSRHVVDKKTKQERMGNV